MKQKFIISANHPLVKNHKAYGQALLPGLAYIDLLYQFFREHGHDFQAWELRNLSIYRPLIVGEANRIELLLQADEVTKDLWSVQLQGLGTSDGLVSEESHLYIKAEMHHHSEAAVFDSSLDFPALQSLSETKISLDDIYTQCSSQQLVHSGIMKAEGVVYSLDDAQIVEVSLPESAQKSAANFMFHPALIDGSSVGSSNLFAALVEGEQRLFLPLFYESFRASALFRDKCFVRVQKASVRRKKDMLYMDLEFFNEAGEKIAQLKNFVNKLVREAAFINPNLQKTDQTQSTKVPQNQETDNQPQATPAQLDKSETWGKIESLLKEIFASFLQCSPEEIETDAGYYELGLDSPTLLQVIAALEKKFTVKLIPTLLFEYTTIEELAGYFIEENHVSKVIINEASNLQEKTKLDPPSTEITKTPVQTETDIAIIGIAGRYPGANNINEFWRNLLAGKDCISEIPPERWDWRTFAQYKSPSGKSLSKWGGFIENADCFDHQFFRISPREAEVLDPQERLFLQTCWECIEDAGYTPETLVGSQGLSPQSLNKSGRPSVGVFVGVMHKDYVFLGAEAIERGEQFHLSLNYAPIANRVSYFCDFHGPSMVIDTVCSSSLTAIHLAVESIRHGESDVALAGGVNLSLHPYKYLTYGLLDMYSSDGRCRTFGSGGDGYVSGEGVGAVVLKPLAQAIQDRDHIYAVIKGSTINHVGKVTGISVPNSVAQSEMIVRCLEKTGINPRTISYVEAHGTGTPLGDPIEIQGLTKAFKSYTNDTQFCAIGSVKSNIGHTESAAGISGLTKVALQLHYQTLVPSLHSQEINPHLDLPASPFYVQRQTQRWETSSLQPRRAALSSFGATGSNAHVIVEEYKPDRKTATQSPEEQQRTSLLLLPLSAKNEERLTVAAQNFYQYLISQPSILPQEKIPQLRDIAYTLQVGRKAMEARLIFLVADREQLLESLQAFLAGDRSQANMWQGQQVKRQKQDSQKDEAKVAQWLSEGRLDKIAQAWVEGFPLNWDSLYELGDNCSNPHRVSLPTYPFAKVRHWVPMEVNTTTPIAALHPLLHRNTSTLKEQRYSSNFKGAEFFLADHRVQGQKILPGVAYLEMARVAVAQATSGSEDSRSIKLKNIVWQQPLAIESDDKTVHISLFAQQNSEIDFEIYTEEESPSEAANAPLLSRRIYCRGKASLGEPSPESYLDLENLQQKTAQNYFTPEQCYQAFQAMGIDYGKRHQGITAVYVGDNQILAELSLPNSLVNNHDQFTLHPSLLDSALQTAIGFGLATQVSDGEQQSSLPYALETLEIQGKCTPSMWVWLRYAANNKADSPIKKFDLDLGDEKGKICVQLRGFSARVLRGSGKPLSPAEAGSPSLLHPLLHHQVSVDDSRFLQFTSRFTGNEFFLREHQQVMLGVAYLEMALSAARFPTGQKILGLKNVVWRRLLLIAGSDQEVSLRLDLSQGEQYRFTINTQGPDSLENIHCQGQLVMGPSSEPEIPKRLRLQEIQSRCNTSITTAQCDRLLQSTHGPSLLTIAQLWHNENEALALLQLPDFMQSEHPDYLLHPSMLNGAILSSVVFSLLKNPSEQLPVPFALDRLWIYKEMPKRAYAYVRANSATKHDIELVDEQGERIVLLQGFTASVQGQWQGSSNSSKNPATSDVIYGSPQWQESFLSGDKLGEKTVSSPMAAPIFILTRENSQLNQKLHQRWPAATIENLASVGEDGKDRGTTFQENFLAIFQRIKTCILAKPKLNQPIVILIPESENAYLYTGFAALLKTAQFENSKIVGKLIRYEVDDRSQDFVDLIAAEIEHSTPDVEVFYEATATRKIKQVKEIAGLNQGKENLLDKIDLLDAGDVIWITGGLGGLGQIMAKHLSQKNGLKLILSGRSPLTPDKTQVLQELISQGNAEISYVSCDIGDQQAVEALVQRIQQNYGRLSGIIHSAGINQDSYILNKTSAEISAVLLPKVRGILTIDEACRNIPLKFMILFSSIAGVFGSIGQADYATANAFLDSFAEARNLRVEQGKCFGKTISINWPLWKDGGMGVDAQTESLMQQNTGMIALTTSAGLRAFDLALSAKFSQILVAQGNTARIRSRLFSPDLATPPTPVKTQQETTKIKEEISHQEPVQEERITRLLHKDLAAFICRLQKIKPEEIDLDAEFSHYGFDSISFTSFANDLNQMYGLELMPTLFFEYSSLRSLAKFLLENHLTTALLPKYQPPKQFTAPEKPTPLPAPFPPEAEKAEEPPVDSQPENRESRIGHAPVKTTHNPVGTVPPEPIAIIGMSGKFPGAENLTEFWHHLAANRDLISEIPQDRWNWRDYYGDHQISSGKTKVKWGGFITGVAHFDPLFFAISPVEAELMDPQFRLFLATVWATIEDAGYRASTLSGSKTGVYVGVTTTDYKDLMQRAQLQENSQEYYGMFPFMLANRVSYILNFRGPSEAIDTACSSSLVAIHRAVESIRQGSCEIAVAGGVNVIANPQLVIAATQGGMLSEDGRCKTFDKSANGYVRGEGVGAVLLKPLAKAIEDKDHIYGLIRGSAENHGGKATSPTAPNPVAQQELLVAAYTQAGIPPETVGYIEAHGTGTALGDPIEINGLKGAYSQLYALYGSVPSEAPHCGLGSVKTNIGHLEAAAGISGVLKVLLMLKYRTIPGNRHLQEPNPYLKLTGSPFYLVKDTQPWTALYDRQQNPLPRRAGVSSFGIGGTNVHLVLEEYIAEPATEAVETEPASLIVLSAKNRERLVEVAQNLAKFISNTPESSGEVPLRLKDLAYTLQVGREEMEYRLGFVATSLVEVEEKLLAFANSKQENQDLYEGSTKGNKDTLEVLESDADLQQMLDKWIEGRKFEQILKLWVKGLTVNWEQLYRGKLPQRISLPTYPFARESYWLPAAIQSPPSPSFTEASPFRQLPSTDGKVAPETGSHRQSPNPKSPIQNPQGDAPSLEGVLCATPSWVIKAVEQTNAPPTYSQHLILFCGIDVPTGLQSYLSKETIYQRLDQSHGEDLTLGYQSFCEQVFTHIKEILQNKPQGKVLVQIVITEPGREHPPSATSLLQGLAALLKTAYRENPKIVGQLIEVEPHQGSEKLIQQIQENVLCPEDFQVRYRQDQREVLSWDSFILTEQEVPDIPWKEGGVYLITGGAGGLGLIFAREIARCLKNVTIVLVGRSPLSQTKQTLLNQETKGLGVRLEYRQADVSQQQEVEALIQGILRDFTKLDGIFHAAGVINDSFIIKKTVEQLRQVLAPKVCGTVYLDWATKDINLDFFVLFSSGAAVVGNVGQADYAAANAFMDSYAAYRQALFLANKRFGRSLSINWPLWQDGGMQVDGQTLKVLRENTGVRAMSTSSGVQALLLALNLKTPQIMVVEGNLSQIRQGFLSAARPPVEASGRGVVDEQYLLAQTLHQCKVLFGGIIKLGTELIEADEALEKYGIDSVIITQMNYRLEAIFGEVSKTLLYEYQTLGELARYLITEYRDKCIAWTGVQSVAEQNLTVNQTADQDFQDLGIFRMSNPISDQDFQDLGIFRMSNPINHEPIAIIGLAGRYGQADTLEEYWQNLQSGKDCVTEIPAERWSLEGFYQEDIEESITQGKSYSKWGSFINGFADFDPLFFAISPREAMGIDPQERLFLQSAWQVLEDAGYTRKILGDSFRQRVGVFVGITKTGFSLYGPELWRRGEFVQPHTSFSSVANRISYLFNLCGPSLAIDTMCSSSLTAIHEACEHIRRRECELAIAGGVNLYLHPACYVQMCTLRMLSPDGKCKSFGEGGNGFVPGEGVGAVLLKPLALAIEDRDNIYGIIRGTSVNHGGKTNGYTVPNPKAQAELIEAALTKAGVDGRTISYIEAHGTGTELGDPIEITGLTQAFRKHTTANSFCALGSAKSNLGHLEAAAGIAGLTKVILQLKHKQIAPSLHAQKLNPNINWAKTPFVLQQTLSPWSRPRLEQEGEMKEYPRRAGISSFGAGGVNAHLIVEEYVRENWVEEIVEAEDDNVFSKGHRIVILSAKNEERLSCIARNLHDYLNSPSATNLTLGDIAYTLQLGREAMEERLGIIVCSLAELKQKLSSFIAGETGITDLYHGQVKGQQKSLALFAEDEELQEAIAKWIQQGKFAKLVELWTQGLVVDWSKLYGKNKPYRVSLPTYPFEQHKYWIADGMPGREPEDLSVSSAQSTAKLHPLIHENTSTLSKQRFSSTFSGQEFFLADHQVQGQRILPAVAYLEMVRTAVTLAMAEPKMEYRLKFLDVVWPRAIVVGDQPLRVHTALQVEDDSTISFEIYTDADHQKTDGQTNSVLHCQGYVAFFYPEPTPDLALAKLQGQCLQTQLTAEQCYQAFASVGIKYGPGHQGIDIVYVGNQQVLAKLRLPSSVATTAEQFGLHPSLMDSALQASIGLAQGREVGGAPKPSLPYALESLEIYALDSLVNWVWIRESVSSNRGGFQKLDLDLATSTGQICLKLRGFSARVLERELVSPESGLNLLTSVWNVVSAKELESQQDNFGQCRVVIAGGTPEQKVMLREVYPDALWLSTTDFREIDRQLESLSFQSEPLHIIWVAPSEPITSVQQESLIREQNQGVLYLFRLLKILLAFGYGDRLLHWTIITTQTQAVHPKERLNPTNASVLGLVGSLAKEYPHWKIRLLDLEAAENWPIERLVDLPAAKNGDVIAYRGKEWFKQSLVPVVKTSFETQIETQGVGQPSYRSQGVYVVIGGAGGIGEVWSRWMIEHYQAQIIWLGRSRKNASIQGKLDALAELGTPPHYIQADASDLEALQSAYQEIKRSYGKIDGVVHAAIVLADKSIAKMDEKQFCDGLRPKIDVSVRLAQVFASEKLDFVLFFSSSQSFAKMPGQSNYAAGCTFEDAFASRLAQEWTCPVKVMNWSYWGSVGVVATRAYRDRMTRAGIGSIEPQEGMEALNFLMKSPLNQLVLFKQLPQMAINHEAENNGLAESVTTYSDAIPACLEDLSKYFTFPESTLINS